MRSGPQHGRTTLRPDLVGPVHVTPLPQLRQFYRAASQFTFCTGSVCSRCRVYLSPHGPHPEGSWNPYLRWLLWGRGDATSRDDDATSRDDVQKQISADRSRLSRRYWPAHPEDRRLRLPGQCLQAVAQVADRFYQPTTVSNPNDPGTPRDVDAEVLKQDDWATLLGSVLENPGTFSAYLHTITWNTASAAYQLLLQAPFRAGIRLARPSSSRAANEGCPRGLWRLGN